MKIPVEPYYKTSKVTGRTYDLFSCIRILNPQQVAYYLDNNVPLQEIETSTDRKTGKPVLVFLFNRADTRIAYDAWCRNKEASYENNGT